MPRVLVTKNITPNQLRLIMDAELLFEVETAVEFSINFDTNDVIQNIKAKRNWLFTSINAVKSIQSLLSKYQNKFEQQIFCIGSNTAKLLKGLGYYSVTTFDSVEVLRSKLDWSQPVKITYFCNNFMEKILPSNADRKIHDVKHVEVFETKLLNPEIPNTDFDYVFYFSPLGAKSILKKNPKLKIRKSLASGPGTLKFLQNQGVKNCLIPDNANLQTMVEYVVNEHKKD